MSPFNAWVLLKGLETLALRVEEHDRNGLAVARFLEDHPGVEQVLHPGLESHPQHALARRQMSGGGNLLAFRTGGGRARAFAVLNRLRLILISNNLGDAKSLITHPATTTHERFSAARARAPRDHRRSAPPLGRPRGPGRSGRRSRPGAERPLTGDLRLSPRSSAAPAGQRGTASG